MSHRVTIIRTRPAGVCIIVFMFLFVLGCATTGINKGQVNIISTREEVVMGEEFSKEVERQFRVFDEPDITTYIESVGRRIVGICDRRDIEYHFAVIMKDEINAFALPGGYIYIHTGLLETLDDESQLAAVLAHEVGHVTARHATERLTAMYGYQLLVGLLLGDNPDFYSNLVSDIFTTTGFLAYSRSNEYEADRLGAKYVHAAGYDPDGMLELLGRFRDMEAREPGRLEEWLSTHPPTGKRMERVKAVIAGFSTGRGERNRDAYRKMKTKLP